MRNEKTGRFAVQENDFAVYLLAMYIIYHRQGKMSGTKKEQSEMLCSKNNKHELLLLLVGNGNVWYNNNML